jgi:hypothetical protein
MFIYHYRNKRQSHLYRQVNTIFTTFYIIRIYYDTFT